MPNQSVPLQDGTLDDFVGRAHIHNDVAHYIYQQRLRLISELDTSRIQHPFRVPLHDGLRDRV